jgi:nucleoside phosphorylase
MVVDRAWVKQNLGFDPISTPVPAAAFATMAATKKEPKDEDFQREIIDFDSEAPEGAAFMAFSKATGLSRFVDIPWPHGLGPVTDKTVRKGTGGRLPKSDYLVVTWTVDEGHALSRVLTPGKDSRNDYLSYRHNFSTISKKMRKGCPALEANRLGAYWTTKIGGKTVVVFKSDSHMSQDGPQLANADVWKQIIDEVQPKLVITTGTSGGIGTQCEVGDVIVSPELRFDCTSKFKNKPFHDASYSSKPANTANFAKAKQLFATNADQLPPANTRPPAIVTVAPGTLNSAIVTTDFFGFDTSDNHYKLQGLGDVSEMGDAVLGMVSQQMGAGAPPYIAVRNVSDPQIDATGLTLKQQAKMAADIYKGFGRWSSVCSAIVCWALIA